MTGLSRDRALELFQALDDAEFSVTLHASTLDRWHPPKNYSIGVTKRDMTSVDLKRLEEILEPFEVDFRFGLVNGPEIHITNRVPAVIR